MNTKSLVLIITSIISQNLKAHDVSLEMINALMVADFAMVEQLIETKKDSVNVTAFGVPLVVWVISNYANPIIKKMRKSRKSEFLEDSKKILIFLLEHNAPINVVHYGETPLHVATDYNLPEIVDILLDHGADTSLRNNDGLTAYELAVEKGNQKVKEVFGKYKMRGGISKVRTSTKGKDVRFSHK